MSSSEKRDGSSNISFFSVYYKPDESYNLIDIPALSDADEALSKTFGSAAKYLWGAGLLAGKVIRMYFNYIDIVIYLHFFKKKNSWTKFNNDRCFGWTVCDGRLFW
jgi:hypothetical protein